MERREDTLRQALQKNEDEIQRWETYSKEQETAITNLEMFSKKLSVDVMVPIGRKAFMPGRLIHTNEVMVGHFQDYFSKCSSYTATEICKRRIEKAKQYLDKLEAEKEFFENKLEGPHLDGVLPNSEEREIIEEYDEEKEKIWRETHRQRIRNAKLKEKQERESIQAQHESVEEIIEKFEEQDMIDELNEELDDGDVDTNRDTQDILAKLMSGEINVPPAKKRVAHDRVDNRENSVKEETNVMESLSPKCEQTEKPAETTVHAGNSDDDSDTKNPAENTAHADISDDDSEANTPPELRLMQDQAEYLPRNERAGFFQYEMRIIDGKIAAIRSSDEEAIQEKMRLLNIRYSLEELIELHEDVPETDSELEKDASAEVKPEKQQKRRISFALEDHMLEFRKNETVAQMMPAKSPTEEKPQRDIIRLDEPVVNTVANDTSSTPKRKTIAEKVEENLKTQTSSDGYLVNQILGSGMHPSNHASNTLQITFKHSTQSPPLAAKSDIPQSPTDLYNLYHASQPEADVNGVVEVKSKEDSREKAFVDVRSEFLSPLANENIPPEMQSKTILKNKAAVGFEKHNDKPRAQKKSVRKPKDDAECLSAYNKVMGDVLENSPVQPDPLPKEKFIDMHTPKKRVSRFKQMRNDSK